MEFLELIFEPILEAILEFAVVRPICSLFGDRKDVSSRGFAFNKLPLSGRELIKLR